MTDDGAEVNEWVAITTLACVYETQLNVVTGETRHRRQTVQPDYSRFPQEIIDAIAVERPWTPGHPQAGECHEIPLD